MIDIEQLAREAGIRAIVEYMVAGETSGDYRASTNQLRAFAEAYHAAKLADVGVEPVRRWRWVDCTPHEGYFEVFADGIWVQFVEHAEYVSALQAIIEQQAERVKVLEAALRYTLETHLHFGVDGRLANKRAWAALKGQA